MNKSPFPLKHQLAELLSESVSQATYREQSTLDDLVKPFYRDFVLFGAGGIGKKALSVLRSAGIEPLAFADNNQSLWGKSVNGVQVFSPAAAAEKFGQIAAFVVTIWSPGAGCSKSATAVEKPWL